MKSFLHLAPLALASVVFAQDLDALKNSIPQCALACITTTAAEEGCSLVDMECQCGKFNIMFKAVAPCLVSAGCELEDMTHTAESVATFCANAGYFSKAAPTPLASESKLTTAGGIPLVRDSALAGTAALVAAVALL